MARNKETWCCSKANCRINSANVKNKNLIMDVGFRLNLHKNFFDIEINSKSVQCLLDSGADISAISKFLLDQVAPDAEIKKSHLNQIIGVCGETHQVLGQVELTFSCNGVVFTQIFHVFQHLHSKILVGIDFLQKYKVQVNFGETEMSVLNLNSVQTIKVPVTTTTSTHTENAKLKEATVVPPHSECVIPVWIPMPPESLVLLEPNNCLSQHELAGGRTVIEVNNFQGTYRLINPTSATVYLKKNFAVAKANLIHQSSISVLENEESAVLSNISAQNSDKSKNYEKLVKELGINIENNHLSEEQKQKLYNFLGKNRDIFAKDMSELGETHLHSHIIETGDAKPVSTAPYRTTPEKRKIIEAELNKMLDSGVIEESTSPWHSGVVLVKKPNNEWRFAVDYRRLNAVTEPMSFPIPHMTDVFDTLADAKASVYSTLDLRSGFWQVPLHESTKQKSAFITESGIFQFKRLSFGLRNAPMTFQQLMSKVLRSLNFKIALVYIDDVLIFSTSFDEHLHHLDLVFQHLRAANLKLHPGKCVFGTDSVKYLGHIVTKEGMKVLPENTDKIRKAKRPRNAKEMKQTLGLFNYYRKFVLNYARIAEPLTKLLRKETEFKWTNECETAFNTLKEKLVTAPILKYPDFTKEFILAVDASDYSIGYVLSQMHEGKEHPICFGGRGLRDVERKWHITDKEGLALVEAVQTYRHYLTNQKFTVYTDNVSVKYLKQIKDQNGRLGRWSILLQSYQFEIKHRSTTANRNADFLSRQQYQDSTPAASSDLADHIGMAAEENQEYTQVSFIYPGEDEVSVLAAINMGAVQQPEPKFPDLANAQKNCPDFSDIFNYLANNDVPTDPKKACVVVAESYNYEIVDGILQHFYSRRGKQVSREERLTRQTAIPRILRDDILKSYHDCIAGGGHQGFERTYGSLRNKYYWPSMYENIRQYVKTCEVCQQSKRAFNAKPPPLHPQPVDDVFNRWQMDILSGLPTSKEKYKHILLVVDSYSKWAEAFPLRTQTCEEVASILFREIISRYGAPRVLLSDRGKNFMSNLVRALAELCQIKTTYTSSYHPMTNGLVESKNSYILQAFRAYCKGQQDDWPDLLPGVLMAYRSTPATQSTDFSPFFLLYGREMNLPVDLALQPKDHLPQNYKVHLQKMLHNLEICRKLAKENVARAQQKYKYQYDKYSKMPEYRPADRVWLYCTKVPQGKAPKLHRKWVGPYYITMLGPNFTYRLRHSRTNKEVKSLVNAMRLKPYFDPSSRPTNPPAELAEDDSELDPEEVPDPQNHKDKQPANDSYHNNYKGQGSKQDKNQNKNESQRENTRPSANKKKGKTCITDQRTQNENKKTNAAKNCKRSREAMKTDTNKETNQESTSTTDTQNIQKDKGNKKKVTFNLYQNMQKSPTTKTPPKSPEDTTKNNPRKIPTCNDCKNKSCIKFSDDEIKEIIEGKWSNGALYYRVKFSDNHTEWHFPCKLHQNFITEFHATRTMNGRKKKQKGKRPKYFKETPSVNSTIRPTTNSVGEHSNRLTGLRFIDGRVYFLKQGNTEEQLFHITSVYQEAASLINTLENKNDERNLNFQIEHLKRQNDQQYIHSRKEKFDDAISSRSIQELRIDINGEIKALVDFRNYHIAPEWLLFKQIPPGNLFFLIQNLKEQYKKFVLHSS